MIAEKETSSRVVVDDHTEWLFICGRDIFKKGILKIEGTKRKGDHTLILNKHGECLGFGRLILDLNEKIAGQQIAVKNISDLGDFLRREKAISR
jgi:archaeosine-15-forming tRNA-guanine transglycosylase